MKYIMPCVPNITIKNNKGEELLIDYVSETNILHLNNEDTLLIMELPLSETKDNLNFLDTYNLELEFDTRTLGNEKIESKNIKLLNMKLVRKTQRYTSELKSEENVYVFYNGKDNIDDLINSCLAHTISTDNDLYFAKVEPNATIPSKRDEDAGYDIYTCETETIIINPNSTRMVDTGIAIACSSNYFPKFFDKGGMGSKGVIVGAGVGDSGYRDKYFIPLINTNSTKWVVITNQSQEEIDNADYFDFDNKLFKKSNGELICNNKIEKSRFIIKPLNKAITQFVMLPVPKMNVKEITYEELKNIKSERGLGKLGSSGK